jgi:hypothetical protein
LILLVGRLTQMLILFNATKVPSNRSRKLP